jgi:hypothetical protein
MLLGPAATEAIASVEETIWKLFLDTLIALDPAWTLPKKGLRADATFVRAGLALRTAVALVTDSWRPCLARTPISASAQALLQNDISTLFLCETVCPLRGKQVGDTY